MIHLAKTPSKIGWETHRIYNFNGNNTIPIRK